MDAKFSSKSNPAQGKMRSRYFTIAAEMLRNEPFDLQDEFSDVEIAEAVSNIVLLVRNRAALRYKQAQILLGKYLVKVENKKRNSFISVSNDEATGVSRSLVHIIDVDKPSADEEDLQNVLEMLNEAYYLMKN